MEEVEREEISRKDIIIYVDMLLQKHRFSYDRKIAPLLYEFFLRSARTFNWSKDEFLDKYINFSKIIKRIKLKKIESLIEGQINIKDKAIYLNKTSLKDLRNFEEDKYNSFIDEFYHECAHATDFEFRDGKQGRDGLLEIESGAEKNLKGNKNPDIMLNEYANIISSALISSDKGLYNSSISYLPNLNGYISIHIPGTIFCTALDIPETTIAKLKDKGRVEFDNYFKEKYPYLKTDVIIEIFRDNLSLIFNSVQNKDKENITLGHLNMIELSNEIIRQKIKSEIIREPNEEFVQRTFYNLQKLYDLINAIEKKYQIDKSHFETMKTYLKDDCFVWNFYKKFKDNEKTMGEEARTSILVQFIKNDELDIKTLVSEIGEEEYTRMPEYDIKEIGDKYYSDLFKPLNDNTELIEHLKKAFVRPTVKEKLNNLKNKFKRTKALPVFETQAIISEKNKVNSFKERIETETPKVPIRKQKTKQQQLKEEKQK